MWLCHGPARHRKLSVTSIRDTALRILAAPRTTCGGPDRTPVPGRGRSSSAQQVLRSPATGGDRGSRYPLASVPASSRTPAPLGIGRPVPGWCSSSPSPARRRLLRHPDHRRLDHFRRPRRHRTRLRSRDDAQHRSGYRRPVGEAIRRARLELAALRQIGEDALQEIINDRWEEATLSGIDFDSISAPTMVSVGIDQAVSSATYVELSTFIMEHTTSAIGLASRKERRQVDAHGPTAAIRAELHRCRIPARQYEPAAGPSHPPRDGDGYSRAQVAAYAAAAAITRPSAGRYGRWSSWSPSSSGSISGSTPRPRSPRTTASASARTVFLLVSGAL